MEEFEEKDEGVEELELLQQKFVDRCDDIFKRAVEGLGLSEKDADYHTIVDSMVAGDPAKALAKVKALEASKKEGSEGKVVSSEEGEEPSTETEINFAKQEAKDKKTQAEIEKRYEYIREKYIEDPTDPKVKAEWAYLRGLRGR